MIGRFVVYLVGILLTLTISACGGSAPVAETSPSAAPTTESTAASEAPAPAIDTPQPSSAPAETAVAPETTAPSASAAPAAAADNPERPGRLRGAGLIPELQKGGYVIFFRHAATDRSQGDTDLSRCETQRNLNDQGRDESRTIGEAFTQLNIPVGDVLSSPYCRARDTAQIAFGRYEESDAITNLTGDDPDRTAKLRELLSTTPESNANLVMVAHGINIINAANIRLREGEAGVFLPQGNGQFEFVARVMPDEWLQLAEAN